MILTSIYWRWSVQRCCGPSDKEAAPEPWISGWFQRLVVCSTLPILSGQTVAFELFSILQEYATLDRCVASFIIHCV